MFADNTLTPREAVRLCALGMLASSDPSVPVRYGRLAGDVRHFISRVAGPQIDLMGEDDSPLVLTALGRRELHTLLTARLRPGSDLSRLIVALKMRFLDLLEPAEKRAQADLMIEGVEGELARLIDLSGTIGADSPLGDWLNHEITSLENRLEWLNHFSGAL